jgi:hypothetical protein
MVVGVAIVLVVAVGYSALQKRSASTAPATVYGTALSYSQTMSALQSALSSRAGGPWQIAAVLGVGDDVSEDAFAGIVSGCTEPWVNSSVIVAPATPSSAAIGYVSTWVAISQNPSSVDLLTVISQVGSTVQGSDIAELQGSCTGQFTGAGFVSGSVIDSPTIANDANLAGGSVFLNSYPAATIIFILLGADWLVEYTTCNFWAQTGGSGQEFLAGYNATSGAVLVPGTDRATSC